MIDPVQAFNMDSSATLLQAAGKGPAIPTTVPVAPTFEQVTETGKHTLWVVFFIMLVASVVFSFLSFRTPVQKRLFHVLTTFITTFAAISYYAMATGDGTSFAHIVVKHVHDETPDTIEHVFRQVFWARYIDWSVTTPLLLLDLAFLAGLNGANILVAIVADVLMVLLGLFAAFGATENQKWGYYAMSCVAFLVIVYQLIVPGRRSVMSKDNATAKLYGAIGGFTLILWTLYPIVWGIGDGARKWSVDAEILAYAVLDVLAKPVFGFWLLFTHAQNAATLEGFWSHGLEHEGSIRISDNE